MPPRPSRRHHSPGRRPTRRAALAAAAALALTAVAACSSDDGGGGDAGSDSDPTEITLGVIPIIDIAPIHLGIEQGFFEEENLRISMQEAQGGAAIVPAVVSGDFQFGYSNIVSLLLARNEGVPVTMVSVGARASDDAMDDGSGQLMTLDDSLTEVEDLAGTTIGVNTLKGINEVAVVSLLKEHGLEADAAKLVEVPIPNMPAALESGQVDAVMVAEPFTTVVEEAGAEALPVSYAGMGQELPFAGWFTSDQYAAENADVVERFTTALTRSLQYAEQHPDEARRTLDSYLRLEPGVSDKVTLPGWNPATEREEISHLAELTVDTGLIDSVDPLDELLAE